MRCFSCDEGLPYDTLVDGETGRYYCVKCWEDIQELLPVPKQPERSRAHDPYGWDVVTRQEPDDFVGTVPTQTPDAEE